MQAQCEDVDNFKKQPREKCDFEKVENHHHHHHQYLQAMKELEFIKQELSKLKLDMICAMEEKSFAEKEAEASGSKMESYLNSVQDIQNEIDEANEEHVLVELARIEALRELEAIKAHNYSYPLELEGRKKEINEIMQEIDRSKELEIKLAETMCDVHVLQNELKQIHNLKSSSHHHQLDIVRVELESAKTDLATIKASSFHLMTSMDIVRDELKRVIEETCQLRKTEEKTVENLNSKLLKLQSSLQSAHKTLHQFKSAKSENEIITSIHAQVHKAESAIDLSEQKLEIAIRELEKVKLSEKIALEELKSTAEKTMRARGGANASTSITISNFEYEYLTGGANEAKQIADKKVAAAEAWIEALKASEREILMMTVKRLTKDNATSCTRIIRVRKSASPLIQIKFYCS